MHRWLRIGIGSLLAALFFAAPVAADEMESRYAKVVYADEALVRSFNEEIVLGGGLFSLGRRPQQLTVQDELRNKLNNLVEKVMAVLEMYPKRLHFTLVLLPNSGEVQRVYRENFGKEVNYIAFYSPKQKTMYLSVRDVELRVIAHEIGHVVVDHYFDVPPPVKIHEVLAQFAETHISD
ncbi:MAG TPA: hypothetical protein VLL73_00090 [Desulfurivibrionaceae bacterium]|nr:hypothetical protein [Desulfurivibrionaceae bacterium]